MTGTEQSKFCSQCGHHVRNLSLMSAAERAELLQRAKTERICGTYLVRLSGEMVTPAAPLSRSEWSRVRQFGVATLSAGALALAAGCVAPPHAPTRADTPHPDSVINASHSPSEQTPAAIESKKEDEEIVLLTGFVVSPQEDEGYRARSLDK